MNSVNFTKCLELLKSLQCRDAAEVWKNFSDRPEGFGDMGIEDVLEVMLTAEKNGRVKNHKIDPLAINSPILQFLPIL